MRTRYLALAVATYLLGCGGDARDLSADSVDAGAGVPAGASEQGGDDGGAGSDDDAGVGAAVDVEEEGAAETAQDSSDAGMQVDTPEEDDDADTTIIAAGAKAIPVLDSVLFYDGYAATVDEPVKEGVVRHKNSLYASRLTKSQLDDLDSATQLAMKVVLQASCDNYDRIGRVQLAWVPKGSDTYDPESVDRIELGRFITPFMDKNAQPDTVPYEFDITNLLPVLQGKWAGDEDLWLELDVFGVPYAAQEEVSGCEGREDVFFGSVTLYADDQGKTVPPPLDVLLPLALNEPFNDYQEGASDAIGSTKKTLAFSLDAAVTQAQVSLIISQHGANQGGEEYVRRRHFVYFDDAKVLEFSPGRDSCEPFRMYNTQPNGIYFLWPLPDEVWQARSNWCPGDKIDTRVIELGDLAAGEHSLVVEVPDAVFLDDQGNFPLSVYLQAASLP